MDEAREQICDAGRRLLTEGLAARTWGNISLRCDEVSFLITPSGRTYEDMEPCDVVRVFLDDLRHEGRIRPSSEKALHAEIYRTRPDVNAVIHTHQVNASIAAAVRREVPVDGETASLATVRVVPVADHAMPGSRKLALATASCLKEGNAALMANHGAVCVGPDMGSAFRVARELEELCGKYIEEGYLRLSGDPGPFDAENMYRYYLKHFSRRRFA